MHAHLSYDTSLAGTILLNFCLIYFHNSFKLLSAWPLVKTAVKLSPRKMNYRSRKYICSFHSQKVGHLMQPPKCWSTLAGWKLANCYILSAIDVLIHFPEFCNHSTLINFSHMTSTTVFFFSCRSHIIDKGVFTAGCCLKRVKTYIPPPPPPPPTPHPHPHPTPVLCHGYSKLISCLLTSWF